MPRVAVEVTTLDVGEITAAPEPVDISPSMVANGAALQVIDNGRAITVSVRNANANDKALTFTRRRPDEAALRDLTLAIPAESTQIVALEGARHVQRDSTIEVDFEDGFTGWVTVTQTPPTHPYTGDQSWFR